LGSLASADGDPAAGSATRNEFGGWLTPARWFAGAGAGCPGPGEGARPMGPACHGNHYGKQATLQSLQPTRRPQPSVPTHPSDPSANEER
jgi:hypothetical protein